jgi:tetraacyldisaccharide 4'-kinase
VSNRVLFVTNGHGEVAIGDRIATELRALGPFVTEHFPLVGTGGATPDFPPVGPRRAMPSGGLVAMGNVRAFARDLGAGWLRLFGDQLGYLRTAAGNAAAVVAVGDAYACALARLCGRPLIFVGTAKSVFVAAYGPFERRILRGAARVFVRDLATAVDLRAHGVVADAPGNVIVDLLATGERFPWTAPMRLALLPGSRERAYADADRLAVLVAAVAERVEGIEAALSIAPGLDPAGFAPALARSPAVHRWTGPIGAILAGATLALGQAGTANEAAAANGVPVVALELEADRRDGWYRKRQVGLLGEALAIVPGELPAAREAIVALLEDPPRLAAMAAAGRTRMGGPGGAATVARAIAAVAGAER